MMIDHTKRAEYRQRFFDGKVVIEFLKKDGTRRTMECTLNSTLIPKAKHRGLSDIDGSKPILDSVMEIIESKEQTPKKTRKDNPDVCVVFDLEKQEWRSFRWDSLQFICGEKCCA